MEVKAKFDHFNVNVTDLNRSIEFYSKALGFTEARRKEAADGSFCIGVSYRWSFAVFVGTHLVERS